MQQIIAIGVAGALGTLTRYGLGLWFSERVGPGFPWGTFVINITGAFILGFLAAVGRQRIGPTLFLALTTGFLGGYTTFSTWTVETLTLAQKGNMTLALTNLVGSAVVGYLAAALGYTCGQTL